MSSTFSFCIIPPEISPLKSYQIHMQKSISIIFFGTHEFAATILEGLINNPLFDITLVITQPDRPVGRTQQLEPSPVKLLAQKRGLTIVQPENLKNYELGVMDYELGITAQYGSIIPSNILKLPK